MRNDTPVDKRPAMAAAGAESVATTVAVDPDLQAIRSIMTPAERTPSAAREVPVEPGKTPPVFRHDAETPGPPRRTVLARWLLGHAASFLRRPDAPRLLAVVVLLGLVLLKPGFVIFSAIMVLLTGLVLYVSVGPDQVQIWVIMRYERLRDRDPAAADRLRKRAVSVSLGLTWIVDRLPERWTAGLYLPDFEGPAHPEKLTSDPFERLARRLARR